MCKKKNSNGVKEVKKKAGKGKSKTAVSGLYPPPPLLPPVLGFVKHQHRAIKQLC